VAAAVPQCEKLMSESGAGVKVLHKTLDILEMVRARPDGLPLAELSRAVSMPKPTVYRILSTLELRGYVGRNKEGAYALTRKLLSVPDEGSVQQLLLKVAPTAIEQLVIACRETVNLGILDGGEVLVVHTIESPQSVRMTSKAGNRRYLHTTALGKVLLAGLSDREVCHLLRLRGLPKVTVHSLSSEQTVLAEIERVRKRGYALDNQENEMDGRCIAAKITSRDGRTIAGLSISVPAFRIDVARLRKLAGPLRQACDAISRSLGA